jgi:predicted transposase YbfD/YdcC
METVLTIIRSIEDPRDLNARHDCAAMIFSTLMASLCGAKSCVDVADFVETNLADLSQIVDFHHGAPSHDSFSRLFRLLNPEQMEIALAAFMRALSHGLGLGATKGVVAIDGKRLRGAYERGKSHMPPLMLNIFDTQTRLSLASHAAPDGNEFAAALAALKSVDLKGCTVTGDALYGQPTMAKAILDRGGAYILKVKANNKKLYPCAVRAFEQADETGKLAFYEQSFSNKAQHDRFERRRGSVIKPPADAPAMPGMVLLGRIEQERRPKVGEPSLHTQYVVISKRMSPEKMMQAVRDHWLVENDLHWPLDVVFSEDSARTRKDHAPQNLSIIRQMALSMLKSHPDTRSIRRKMNMAAWSKEFFFELFTHMR